MKLTKIIPARRKTVRFKWAYKNFLQCTEKYIRIRKSSGGKSGFSCDWCKKKFEIDEWFALAQPMPKQEGPKRNWTLCHTCADSMGAPFRESNKSEFIEKNEIGI